MKKSFKIIGIVLAVLLVIVVAGSAIMGITPLAMGIHSPVCNTEGVAIEGYDATSYFTGTPVKGLDSFSQNWNGADWHFASAENLELFKSNPDKYAPAYGGYCAFAASKGFAARPDPNSYQIVNDKLYLLKEQSVVDEWNTAKAENIAIADKNWK